MNRRQFNTRLAALGLAPMAPVPAVARASAPLSGRAAMHYSWAARYVRVHDGCTPAALARAFRLPGSVASELFTKLQLDGVISAPGLTGVARAVDPINWDLQFSPSTAQTTRQALRTRLKRMLEGESETGTSEPDERPVADPVKAARKTESEPTPEAQPTGSAESRPAGNR